AGAAAGWQVVGSKSNVVTAIYPSSANNICTHSLGSPAPLSMFACGNIDPLGITGTPVIDEVSGTFYVDTMITDVARPRHRIFALSVKEGSPLPGWPIDVADALRGRSESFDSKVQNQRGALALLNGTLYVPYGGF